MKEEELKKVIEKVPKSAFKTGLTRLQIKKIYKKGFQKGKSLALKEVGEKIENIDIELMLTDIKDKEGNLYELSEPIMEIISIWWQGKKEELLSSLDNHSQVRSKEPSKNGNGAVKRR